MKQLANFNRQFLVDLRRAYGEPDPSGHDGMVSPVFRDSGEWKRVTGGRDDHKVAAATAAAAAAAAAASNRLLDDDPFKPPAAPDVDRGPRQMLEVFLKSAPFLKVIISLVGGNFWLLVNGCFSAPASSLTHLTNSRDVFGISYARS